MADGGQGGFGFRAPGWCVLADDQLIIEFFACGGGASEALKEALGRGPDYAVNHDEWALGLHAANHPNTIHLPEDVFSVNIVQLLGAWRFGWFHASPDCTHFSQAMGGQPRDRATRSLSWSIVKVVGTTAKAGKAPAHMSEIHANSVIRKGVEFHYAFDRFQLSREQLFAYVMEALAA